MINLGSAGKPLNFSGSTLESFEEIRKRGLNIEEVQFVRGIWMDEDDAPKYKKEREKHELLVSVHAPYYINLASSKEDTIDKSVERIFRSAKLLSKMGGGPVVFHPGYYGDRSKEETYSLMKKGMIRVQKKLKEKGIENVEIRPENMGGEAKFGSVDEIVRLSKEIKMVKPTIDFAHVHSRGRGSLETKEDFIEIFEKIEGVLGREALDNLHTHFTCVKYSEKGEEKHLTLDSKEPDFGLLAEAMKAYDIRDMTIISESPILDKDSLKMKKILDKKGFEVP